MIHPNDFNVNLPDEGYDGDVACDMVLVGNNRGPRQIDWQLSLIGLAKIYYSFHQGIRAGTWSGSNAAMFVLQTDEQIATFFSQLPWWFQAEYDNPVALPQLAKTLSWIKTQRLRLHMMAYEARININSILYSLHTTHRTEIVRAHAICRSSSRMILNLALAAQNDLSFSWY